MKYDQSIRFYTILGIVLLLAGVLAGSIHASDIDEKTSVGLSLSINKRSSVYGNSRNLYRKDLILLSDYWNCDDNGHELDGDGFCIYCGEYIGYDDPGDDPGGDPGDDPDIPPDDEWNCDINGHDYTDGFCVYCGEPDPSWDHDCNVDGHVYNEGYCIYCGEEEPSYDPSPSPSPSISPSPEPSEEPIDDDSLTEGQYRAGVLGILIFFAVVVLFYLSYKFLRLFF